MTKNYVVLNVVCNEDNHPLTPYEFDMPLETGADLARINELSDYILEESENTLHLEMNGVRAMQVENDVHHPLTEEIVDKLIVGDWDEDVTTATSKIAAEDLADYLYAEIFEESGIFDETELTLKLSEAIELYLSDRE